jgi:N6-L-threonylcarbamoyladenine synthase
MQSIRILAIESSCDDTSASVIENGRILSNIIANQEIHRLYGGVVPEVASRKHQINIVPTVSRALEEAGVEKKDLDAIAVTRGPGLMGSLIVGVSFAKSLALSLKIPLIEINHMHAHVMALFIEDPKPAYPFLCLTVSGGHTQIVRIDDAFSFNILGKTLDDAAGEAFDKTGKLLGLDYPAGPIIDKLARQGQPVFQFPEPRIPGLDFSFSGLKTSILYFLRENMAKDPEFIRKNLDDICASVQDRIVSILINKVRLASEMTGIREVAIAGGVSANSGLREALLKTGEELGWNTYIPKMAYCTDNAAMIAMTAHFKYLKKEFADQRLSPEPRYDKVN